MKNVIAAAAGLTVGYLVFKPKVGAVGAKKRLHYDKENFYEVTKEVSLIEYYTFTDRIRVFGVNNEIILDQSNFSKGEVQKLLGTRATNRLFKNEVERRMGQRKYELYGNGLKINILLPL